MTIGGLDRVKITEHLQQGILEMVTLLPEQDTWCSKGKQAGGQSWVDPALSERPFHTGTHQPQCEPSQVACSSLVPAGLRERQATGILASCWLEQEVGLGW